MDLVLEGMRLANSTDKEFPCNHCFKPFEDVSQLLRHVSHSNLCLSHYGPDFVKGLREECRRKSKRKWVALNEESVRQKAKERGRKRNCYVPNSVKHSEMGRAFTDVFRDVFNEYKKQAREDVKEHSEKRWLFLTKDQISDALDESFGDLFEVVRSMQYTKEEEGSNEEIMDRMFVKIEARFNWLLKWKSGDKSYWWEKSKLRIIDSELFQYSLNTAFKEIFNGEKCKMLLSECEDFALDEVFLNLIVTEHYFNDEEDLTKSTENVFWKKLKANLSLRSKESGLESEMKNLMIKILEKKVYFDELEYLKPKK